MSTIAILAVIFSLFIIIKISIVLINPHGWLRIANVLLSNTKIMTIAYFILAAIVGYHILRNFSIVQVASVMLFTSLLIGLALIPFSETMFYASEELLGSRRDILCKTWPTLLIWLAIAVWTLYEVFTKKIFVLDCIP